MKQNVVVVGAFGRGYLHYSVQEAVKERPKGGYDKIQRKDTSPVSCFHQIALPPKVSRTSGTAPPLEDRPPHHKSFADDSHSNHNGRFSKHKHACHDGQGRFLDASSDCFLRSLLNNNLNFETQYDDTRT